jgi:hypothetical protein
MRLANIVQDQLVNFVIYTFIALVYNYVEFDGDLMVSPYFLPMVTFSILLLMSSITMIYLGQRITNHILLTLFLPQILGLFILIFIAISNRRGGYLLGYGIDEILWSALLITSLLNLRIYLRQRICIQKRIR